jgi:hypothetical protein
LQRKNKQKKSYLPTAEEFLEFIPKKGEFEWSTNEEGLVEIKVPKFKGNFGKSFCKVMRKDNTFTAKMDKIGSVVWKNSDGKNKVKDILEILKNELPDEKDLDQRLFLFLQQMNILGYTSIYCKQHK